MEIRLYFSFFSLLLFVWEIEPATRALRIDNFVRPFTDLALKSLLESGGERGGGSGEEVAEEEEEEEEEEERGGDTAVSLLRLDSKKTHCYVMYARSPRLDWIGFYGRRSLLSTFCSLDSRSFPSVARAQWVRNAVYNFKWPLPHGLQLRPKFVPLEEARGQRTTEEAKSKSRRDHVTHRPTHQDTCTDDRTQTEPRRNPADEPLSLDDIFLKTTAEPPLYYLPLSEEQARARIKRKDEDERMRAVKRRRLRAAEEEEEEERQRQRQRQHQHQYGERARGAYRAAGERRRPPGGAAMHDRSRDRRGYREYRR